MIKSLRKRHVQVWTTMSLLLPLGIIGAWLVVPKPVKDHLLQPSSTIALPVIIKTMENDKYTVSIRSSEDRSSLQLEWVNKSVLTAPSAIIYEIIPTNSGNDLDEAGLIGRIDSRGIYHFPLNNSSNNSLHFVLYDIIHHQIIDRINF